MVRTVRWDVVVVGGANTDYLVRAARLPAPGETVEGETFHVGAGGKALNQAVAAARLGGKVALVTRVGRDARGADLVAAMRREGVDSRYVSRDPRLPSGVALITVAHSGEKQIATAPGAARALSIGDIRAAEDALRSARVLLAPLEAPLEVLQVAAEVARAAGAQVVLDAGPATAVPDALLQRVNVLRANATEATALTGGQVRDRASARQAARWLLAQGVGAAVVQAGDEGDLLVWSQGERFLPRLDVASVDATGAGDAFAAALAVLLAEGRGLEEAAVFANAAAALATTVIGAQAALPTRAQVTAVLARP